MSFNSKTSPLEAIWKAKIAELAFHLDGAFPQYHGDLTKDRSFANFLSDYNLASDRFGFDEKRRALSG